MEVYIKKIDGHDGIPLFIPCTKDGEPIGSVIGTTVTSEVNYRTEITCTFFVDGFFEEKD